MDAALIALLRADLLAARYTVDRLRQLWGDEADAALGRGDRLPALRALTASGSCAKDPAGILARLFMLDELVADELLTLAMPTLGAAGARALALLDDQGRALLDLRPYSAIDAGGAVQWFIASDHLGELALGHALPPDHVLGVGGASLTLAALIPTEPVDSVLDLGTGCGIQSLHVARHARRVVATDISERAIDRARLTLALNGAESVDLRQGDLFAPVAGELFDRIVSNPPFVITLRQTTTVLATVSPGCASGSTRPTSTAGSSSANGRARLSTLRRGSATAARASAPSSTRGSPPTGSMTSRLAA